MKLSIRNPAQNPMNLLFTRRFYKETDHLINEAKFKNAYYFNS